MPDRDRRLSFDTFGVSIAVDLVHRCQRSACASPGITENLSDLLPPGARSHPDSIPPSTTLRVECRGDALRLVGEDGAIQTFASSTLCLHALDGAIRSAIAIQAPGLVFVHAGVVAVDGRAVVLPGRSMSGKTTLVAAMVEAGATYLSDEYAVFDPDGWVHPYARRLSIRGPEGRREVQVTELGGVTAVGPHPVALVGMLTFHDGGSWDVVPGGQAECARGLLENAVAAQSRSVEVLRVAATVARFARCVRGSRGESGASVAFLMELSRR